MKSAYRKKKITYDIVGNEHYIMKRMHRNKNVQWITKGMQDKKKNKHLITKSAQHTILNVCTT